MLNHQQYQQAFAEFTGRTAEYKDALAWLQAHHQLLDFDQIRSVLSVGGGTGLFDIELTRLMPALQQYVVIDPNPDQLAVFQERVRGDHRFEFYTKRIEEAVVGGDCELVLLSQCLYYLDRRFVFDQLPKYTRSILIFHQSEHGIYALQEHFCPDNPFHYCSRNIEAELVRAGLAYTKHRVDSYVDVRRPNADLIRFFLEKDADADEIQAVSDYLETHHPLGFMYHPVDIFKVVIG